MKNTEIEKNTIGISLDGIPTETNEQLKQIAKAEGRSVRSLLRRIIQQYVNDYKL